MREVIIVLLFALSLCCQAQDVFPSFPGMDHVSANRAFLEKSKQLVKSEDTPETVCIVNPTRQNDTECYWSFVVMYWLAQTGKFSYIYTDMNAFIAMLCDRYVMGDVQVKQHDVEGYVGIYCEKYNINPTYMMQLLLGIKSHNEHANKKVRIRGLDYDYDILPYYDKPYHLVDSLVQCAMNQSTFKPTRDYLITHSQQERDAIGDSYDVYRRFFDIDRVYTNLTTSLESRMYEEYEYWHGIEPKESKSILFMSLWSMRDVPGIQNFRSKMKRQINDRDYIIINLMDEPSKQIVN